MLIASLRNAQTSDGYTAAATLPCAGTTRLNVTVSGALVTYQLLQPGQPGLREDQGNWSVEAVLAPGFFNWRRRIAAVRFRSTTAGKPAQVLVEALD